MDRQRKDKGQENIGKKKVAPENLPITTSNASKHIEGVASQTQFGVSDYTKVRSSMLDQMQFGISDYTKARSSILDRTQLGIPDYTRVRNSVLARTQFEVPDYTKTTSNILDRMQLGLRDYTKATDGMLDRMGDVRISIPSPSSNWFLTKPLIKEMYLTNDDNDSKYIFKKISKDDYKLCQDYGEVNDNPKHILENKLTNESIPLEDVATSLSITDIIKGISIDDVVSFYNHLTKYPMLGMEHKVGRKIFDEISLLSLTEFAELEFYRVRERNPKEREAPFTEVEMFKAPYGLSKIGRFNGNGQGELYTCESKKIALKEIASDNTKSRFEVIKWQLTKWLKLLDLSGSDSPLVKYCSFQKKTDNGHEYILPNYIAQCVKFHQISGIRYLSVVEPNTKNYVFFD